LGLAVRTLPAGIAYGVWVGIGAVGTAILGLYYSVSQLQYLNSSV